MIKEEFEFSDKSKFKSFGSQLKRSIAIGKKNIKIYYNKGPVVIQSMLFPIILFFAFTIGRNIQPIHIISGLMTMVLFLSATSIGPITFPWETRNKTLERLITTPISIKTVLMGDIWASFIFGAIFSLVPLFLGLIIFSFWSSINLTIIILGILAAAFSFSCLGIILSVPPADMPQNTMVLTVLIKFPLIFMSPLFMPIESLPIAIFSPLTYFVDIINFGLSGNSAFGEIGLLIDFSFLLIFGFGLLFLAFKLHGKTLQKRFRG
ncbi:MAG: ABC transporter permease [Promethearchaeota archaeon]